MAEPLHGWIAAVTAMGLLAAGGTGAPGPPSGLGLRAAELRNLSSGPEAAEWLDRSTAPSAAEPLGVPMLKSSAPRSPCSGSSVVDSTSERLGSVAPSSSCQDVVMEPWPVLFPGHSFRGSSCRCSVGEPSAGKLTATAPWPGRISVARSVRLSPTPWNLNPKLYKAPRALNPKTLLCLKTLNPEPYKLLTPSPKPQRNPTPSTARPSGWLQSIWHSWAPHVTLECDRCQLQETLRSAAAADVRKLRSALGAQA